MGLFDLPAPVLSFIDGQATRLLPPALMLLVWAAAAAILSMEAYRALSPQRSITALRTRLTRAQNRLAGYDGPFEGAWPLIRRMLGLALKRVGVVLPASLAASIPLLMLIIWLDGSYAREMPPPGETVEVTAPGEFSGQWVEGETGARAVVSNGTGETVADVPVAAPIPVVHKKRWWNVFIGNPAGYLDDDAPVDRIDITLPRREMVQAGPSWLRRWEIVFFPALIVMALAIKSVRRIE